ncbi:hypothetical protein I6H07_10800 [Hafnia alvei]|uniref:hypothetical protein n=1 Tax=Hafnia alvei TaxID=569 RepID=UPI000B706136|nr:hypothetical protein [Hafnia alvei]MBI0276287.1 hypothetical protein [Hafnia alvei]PNK97188.1 hypothetical protein CEQ28_006010 [Hafnia alvei]
MNASEIKFKQPYNKFHGAKNIDRPEIYIDHSAVPDFGEPELFIDFNANPDFGEIENHINSTQLVTQRYQCNETIECTPSVLNVNIPEIYIDLKIKKPTLESLGKNKNSETDELCGIGQYIFEYMNNSARRELKPASKIATLQALSAISPNIKGYNNVTMGLLTFTVCESGSGKEKPQEIFDEIAVSAGMAAAEAPTSTKSIYMDIFHGKGRAAFLVDEAHEMLNSMRGIGAKKSEHSSGMEGAFLKLSTKQYAKLSPTHLNTMIEFIQSEIDRDKKRIANYEKHKDDDENIIDVDKANSMTDKAKMRIKYRKEAIVNMKKTKRIDGVRINLFGSSTPREMRPHINKRSIQNGFLGRVIIGWSDNICKLKTPSTNEVEKEALLQYMEYISNVKGEITTTDEVRCFLDDVKFKYDSDEFLENIDYGALYRRVYENTCRIASLLAVGNFDLKITLAQAKAALSIVVESLNAIIALCETGGSESEQYDFEIEMETRIYQIINKNKNEHGYCYLSTLKDKYFNTKKISSKLNTFKLKPEQMMKKLVSSGYLSIADPNKRPAYKIEDMGIKRRITTNMN